MKIERALISVSDKIGVASFVGELSNLGVEIIATSGTLKVLKKNGIEFVKHVSDVTDFPEILGGRVKTLHPKLIGGILALRNQKDHQDELDKLDIKLIDMIVCNLYPADKIIGQGENLKAILDEIDIGGPALIRAAAKNFESVVVITNPRRYNQVLKELREKGDISIQTRHTLAIEAFRKTARYDHAIYEFLKKDLKRRK
jgi:phosphoribosylaminoimidazolecarboxamide formyltransferase/IMP cyclohydrolase